MHTLHTLGSWLYRFHAKPKRTRPREGGKAKRGALKNVGVAINRGGACHCTVMGQGPSSTDATHVKTSA